jgi:hypothetical protein
MATQEEIKKTILKVAGNPVAGPVASLAAQMAEAIIELDNPVAQPKKQKRVLETMETREAGSVGEEA